MSQNLQNFVKFQKFQLENLVDFEKCCKTHIFLQKSEPIQPKTSNILPKFCQPTLSDVSGRLRPRSSPSRSASRCRALGEGVCRCSSGAESPVSVVPGCSATASAERGIFRKCIFSKILQIFGGLVLGCIKTKFCKKICVRQHFSSSTRFASFCTAAISKFSQKIGLKKQQFS